MRAIKTVGIVAVVLVAAVLVYPFLINRDEPAAVLQAPNQVNTPEPDSNVLTDVGDTESEITVAQPLDVAEADPNNTAEVADAASAQLSSNYPPLAAYEIGHEPVKDDELISLVRRLNNDPALLADLINELRAESDPARLKRLVYILGSTANSAVLPAAQELIYSGVPSARDTGLDLLSRIAPNNPEAFEIASNLLVSETEPDVLVATMNVMAQPSGITPEFRESLVTQITPLSTHESTKVRSLSVSMLSRLTNDPSASTVFYNALYDSEPNVRSASVYAYSSFPYHSAEVSQKLLDMAEDPSESNEVRRGAMMALKSNSPDELTLSRLKQAELAMRQQVRQKRIDGN